MADAGKIVITPKGAYSSTKTYEWLDEVSYNGNAYVALKTVTGVTPSDDGVNWRLFMSSEDVDANVLVPKFTEASTRSNIVSGENLSTMFGKIKKWFTDLKSHAFKDLVNNLTTSTTGSALDASQGKILKDEVDGVNRKLSGIEKGAEATAATISGSNPTVTNSANAPLIYGKIKGYTLQDGEPTPDNPIDIQGVGNGGTIEVKTCGKNLFNPEKTIGGQMIWWETGYPYEVADYFITDYIEVNPNTTYTVRGFIDSHENWYYDADKIPIQSIGGCDLTTFTTPDNCKYIRLTAEISTKGIQQIELGDTATDLEPYTETTATIPIDTLYEGDYIELFADGSGQIVRTKGVKVFKGDEYFYHEDSWTNSNAFYNSSAISDIKPISGFGTKANILCSHLKADTPGHIANYESNDGLIGVGGTSGKQIFISIAGITTPSQLNTFMKENPITVVYELAKTKNEPLTAEQVAEFKKLQTFKCVTNVTADGEVTVRYYCNNDSGETVGMLQNIANNSVSKSSIANNLTTTTEGMVLDATQGKTLNDKISTLNNNLEWKTLTHNSASITSINGNIFVDIITNSDKIKNANEIIVQFNHGQRETYIKLQRIPNVDLSSNCATYIQSSDLIMCVECMVQWSTGSVAISCVANGWGLEAAPISVNANTVMYR